LALASACGRSGPSDATGVEGSIVVSAASSLGGAFERIAAAFHRSHPRATVALNLGASSALATQILSGAPADVFASADPDSIDRAVAAGVVVGAPTVFARNGLAIVTKRGNPANIQTLRDLASAGVVSLCAVGSPCGNYAQVALDHAGVSIAESSITRGQNAAATLAAVADGDAVAGIVYVTDATATTKVTMVAIPAADNVVARYPIALLARGRRSAVARAFVAFVLGASGQRVLRSFGFLPAS
jgi:molybdate transport system substrate-binding protein